jgi:heme/copper-type cytochrome/quinol oxidase subunit 2
MQTISHGLSNFCGAIAAWLCLAPVVFARELPSIPSALAPASAPVHHIADLSLFLMWMMGGIFLVAGGVLAFAPFKFRAGKSDSLSRLARIYQTTEVNLAWTAIPVLVPVSSSRKRSDRLHDGQPSRSQHQHTPIEITKIGMSPLLYPRSFGI